MRAFTRQNLLQLAETSAVNLVSIYMPTHTGAESQQDPIRYKNLAATAEKRLIKNGVRAPAARKLLASIDEAIGQQNVWQTQGPSLAVFANAEEVRIWRLPFECDERCVVGNYFHVLPLLTWLNKDAPYFVLAVSQNDVRLFHGRGSSIEEISVPAMPKNLQVALRLDDPQPSRQQHTAQRGMPGKQGLVFHGQGGAPDAAKQEILAYCREIDGALADVLRERTEPLIFAGVEYLFPIYQEANRYSHLYPNPVIGNSELWSPGDIQQRAWPLVEGMIHERREAALSKYGNSIPLDQARDQVDEILLAAHAGVVDTLLIDLAGRVTGEFDAARLEVRVDEQPSDEGEDLLNLAAVLVLRSRGMVEALESAEIPGGGPMAAILRYPFPSAKETAGASGRR